MRQSGASFTLACAIGGSLLFLPAMAHSTNAGHVRELLATYPGACIVEPEWQELCAEAMIEFQAANPPIALPSSLEDAKVPAPAPDPPEPTEEH